MRKTCKITVFKISKTCRLTVLLVEKFVSLPQNYWIDYCYETS